MPRYVAKVAAHEKEIGEMKLHQASRESFCPLVEKLEGEIKPLQDFVVKAEAQTSTSRTWWNNLKPAFWMIAGMIGTLILLHSKHLVKAVSR